MEAITMLLSSVFTIYFDKWAMATNHGLTPYVHVITSLGSRHLW